MRVSLSWLRDYVDLPSEKAQLQALLGRLEMAGLTIDAIEQPWAGARGISAGLVLRVQKHPELDKLLVADVDLGPAGKVTLVSGAGNFRAGDIVPVVAAGGALPGGQTIGPVEFKGIVSQGMMCSAAELGLGHGTEAEDRIVILPAGTAPGTDCISLLGLDDEVLELDLTPNYAVFCQSMLGVAREVAAVSGAALREPAPGTGDHALTGPASSSAARDLASGEAGQAAAVVIAAPELCDRYSGALFEDVVVGPSPLWMQRRLIAGGLRPLNSLVDVTNYVMLELGQPLHAFDFDTLSGRRIVVRRAAHGERLVSLDGTERELGPDDLAIADADRAVAIAGVMGGANTEISPTTRRVFLESAHFAPISVRRTSRRLGLRTEASIRFEKGVDPSGTVRAIERAAGLFSEIGAARRVSGVIDVVAAATTPMTVRVSTDYVRTLAGAPIAGAQMVSLLATLGLDASVEPGPAGPDGAGSTLRVEVPTRRSDIEGGADIVEEIARAYGYDRIEPALPSGGMPLTARPARRAATMAAGQVLRGYGLDELVTFSYHSAAEFDRLMLPPDHPWRLSIPLANPMTEDQARMRTSLVPNLLRVLGYNAGYGVTDLHAFEINRVYLPQSLPLTDLPSEPLRVAIVLTGTAPGAANWRGGDGPVDFYLLKGVIEGLAESMRLDNLSFEPGTAAFTRRGRTATISCDDRALGWLGELTADAAAGYGLRPPVYLAELDFETMIELSGPYRVFRGLPRFPAVQRDLAFVVPDDLPAARVTRIIAEAGGETLTDLRLFDVYRGAQVGAGKRSLAFALTFRSPEQTLTDEQVDLTCAQIVGRMADAGGVLRAQ
ncbi:MAG: phenylalanine--tRNA ligase subunit beta [Bacillota bacterium]|nr:phenylalanine--tRNA ligase subunit beta [Bacillota bacterium]